MDKELILEKIKELSENRLTLFEPSSRNSGSDMMLLRIDNYKEAMDLTLYLLKTCIMALQADYVADEFIGEPEFNTSEVLKLVTQLLPYEEMEFLDEVSTLMKQLELKK